jgi:hypothetical protein
MSPLQNSPMPISGVSEMKKGNIVGVEVVAAFLDCNERTVQNYVKDGIIPKAGHGKYNLIDCVRSLIRFYRLKDDKTEIDDIVKKQAIADLEKTQNAATKLRLENEAKSGYLINANDVEPFFQGVLVTLRQQLLGLGYAIAGEVILCETELEIAQAFNNAVEGVLDEVSRANLHFTGDCSLDTPSEDVGEDEAPPAATA